MAASKSSDSSKKFFDVAKPGKTMPSSSARPAIVGHRTLLKDPMMAEETSKKEADNTDDMPPVSTSVPKLQPLTEAEKETTPPDKPLEPAEPPQKDESKITVKTTEPKKSATAVPKIDSKPPPEEEVASQPDAETPEDKISDSPEGSETTDSPKEEAAGTNETDSESAGTKDAADKQAEKAAAEAAAKLEAVEKIITDKTYFVPIGEKKHRRSNRRTWLLAVLVLIVGAYLAVDAKLIDNNITLPLHVFKFANPIPAEPPTSDTAIAPIFTLPQSGLKMAHDPAIWRAIPNQSSVADAYTASLIMEGTEEYSYEISATETKIDPEAPRVATCGKDGSCASKYLNLETQKLSAGSPTDLFFYNMIYTYTVSKGTFFQPQCGVNGLASIADYQAGKSLTIPVPEKDYEISLICVILGKTDSLPLRFSTLEEAQNWFKTSEEYQRLKTVLTGIKY